MEFVDLFDFSEVFGPGGEDNPLYRYGDCDLYLDIPYDLQSKWARLRFEHCSYLYVYPFPGQVPEGLVPSVIYRPSVLIEVLNSPMVEAALTHFGPEYQPTRRHFYLLLDWANMIFQVIANDIELLEPPRALCQAQSARGG